MLAATDRAVKAAPPGGPRGPALTALLHRATRRVLDAPRAHRSAASTPLTATGTTDKQGSRLLRWAAVEAVSGAVRDPQIASVKARVGARRGRNIGRVAAARHLLTLVYYGLRDGEIRCLAHRRGVRSGTATTQLVIGMTVRHGAVA